MNLTQVIDTLKKAGFSGAGLANAAAIVLAESGGNPNARHVNTNGTVDRGLFQINSIHTSISDACAYNPSCAAAAAFRLSGRGTNFAPWCTAWSNPSSNCGHGNLSKVQSGSAAGGHLMQVESALAAMGRGLPPPDQQAKSPGDVANNAGQAVASLFGGGVAGALTMVGYFVLGIALIVVGLVIMLSGEKARIQKGLAQSLEMAA